MFSIRTLLDQLGVDILRTPPAIHTKRATDLIKRYDRFKNIGILDTSIGSKNLGDFIIMKSVFEHIDDMFVYKAYINTFPTHLHITGKDRHLVAEKELLFVGGTNIINCENIRSQWKLRHNDLKFYHKRCVLMGCGASAYNRKPSQLTKLFLKSILSDQYLHSVRDEYTKGILNDMGIYNVINTCCPTTWNLALANETRQKKQNVVTTLTDYNQDLGQDRRMLTILSSHYEKVYVWIQSISDLGYLKELVDLTQPNNISIIPPSLEAYKQHLDATRVDYVGTRLHAGIFAMQHGVRSLVIGIDNRAREIGRDINLYVIERTSIEDIHRFINGDTKGDLNVPISKVEEWKKQFN